MGPSGARVRGSARESGWATLGRRRRTSAFTAGRILTPIDPRRSAHIVPIAHAGSALTGGRKVASSNLAAPTRREPTSEAGVRASRDLRAAAGSRAPYDWAPASCGILADHRRSDPVHERDRVVGQAARP